MNKSPLHKEAERLAKADEKRLRIEFKPRHKSKKQSTLNLRGLL